MKKELKVNEYIVTLELIITAENESQAREKFWEQAIEDKGWLHLTVNKNE